MGNKYILMHACLGTKMKELVRVTDLDISDRCGVEEEGRVLPYSVEVENIPNVETVVTVASIQLKQHTVADLILLSNL